ncbi:hypothetical protein [Hymenobacter sp. BRD67]|nr:hypothetical protein [Hymenobacter sp. BRD67]
MALDELLAAADQLQPPCQAVGRLLDLHVAKAVPGYTGAADT